jgi:outer membrane protein assembly factor BamA
VAASIEESTGWKIEAGSVTLRFLPARFRAAGLEVGVDGRMVATSEEVQMRWRWRSLLGQPRRLETLHLDGVTLELDNLPDTPAAETDATDPSVILESFEIGDLRVTGGRATDTSFGIGGVFDGVTVDGRLEKGTAHLELVVGEVAVVRSGRTLELGNLILRAFGDGRGLRVDEFEIGGQSAALRAAGDLELAPSTEGRFDIRGEADLRKVTGWWDPNLVSGLDPNGRLVIEGHVGFSPATGLDVEVVHHGDPLSVVGYDLSTLAVVYRDNRPSVSVSHPAWGRAEVIVVGPATAAVSIHLEDAPVDRALAFTAPQVAAWVKGPASLSGELDGTISYPVVAEAIEGRFDLSLSWAEGRVAARGEGANTDWRLSKLEVEAAGATIAGAGRLTDGEIEAELSLSAEKPRSVVERIGDRLPQVAALAIDGGPLTAEVQLNGVIDALEFDGTLLWIEPVIAGRSLGRWSLEAAGGLDSINWRTDLRLSPEIALAGSGTARPLVAEAEGAWRFEASSLAEAATVLDLAIDLPVDGRLDGSGTFVAAGNVFRVDGEIEGRELSVGDTVVPKMEASFTMKPDRVEIPSLTAGVFGGTVAGSLTVPLTGFDQHFRADVVWSDLDLGALPYEVPEQARGRLDGRLGLGGRLTHPQGELDVTWVASNAEPLLERFRVLAGLEGGVVRVGAEETQTTVGALLAEATVPLGDLKRPEWLWPDAPGGAIRVSLTGRRLRTEPLREFFGFQDVGVEVASDLSAEVAWDPTRPETPYVLAEAHGLRVIHRSGELSAEGPLTLTLDGKRLEIAPVVLTGMGSRIEAEAIYDPVGEVVTGRVRAELSPEVARMAPLPVSVDGPLTIAADLEAPASVSTSFESIRGVVTIDHGEGTMVMRDPPLEVRGLQLAAELEGGVISDLDGSAVVNRGRVIFGGAWNPATGQGVVLELQGVTAYTAGILSKWDGHLALEPHPEKTALITGDLTLIAGLWDERLDLASAVLGQASAELAGDDPLHDIDLDLTVRGRAGVRVDNNLGRFTANWDVLRIAGTAAVPVIRGEVRIAPGGVLGLAGHEVAVRRGSLEFTGDPVLDPVVEIVPETDTTLYGGAEEGSFDAALMAKKGLAEGISSVLGFENETLRPAEIAVQTEKDPSERFMVGQRLNRNLALFLATNLSDVQDRTTMLQLWNIEGLRGLAIQGYQETVDDSSGVNVFQRFEWGGARSDAGRPEIHRLRLDGEWPISKRKLRKSTRLRRAQPFDPFLLFVAAVRMERTLAESGYQEARVTGVQEGPDASPTLVFTCEPGPFRPVEFAGDKLSEHVRHEVTALYRPPPLENLAFDNMRAVVDRNLTAEGFIETEIVVERQTEAIVVNVRRGKKVELTGPVLEGVSVDTVRQVVGLLGTPTAMATMVNRPDWASATVERALKNAGYLQGRVLDVWLVPVDDSTSEVRIAVDAGPREVVDLVTVTGRDPLGLTAETGFAVRPGVFLDRPAIDSATRDLRDAYIDAGYRAAVADNTIRRDEEHGWVVDIQLDPGRQRIVREVRFSGRRHVSERVLGKGVTLDQGEVLTDAEVDRSASRIANFSPIERVDVATIDRGASEVDLEIAVSEKARWATEVGVGWSTERGFGAAFGLRDDNILARGVGLNLRGSWDATEKKVFLIGSVPPVPGGRLSFITTVGYSSGDAPEAPEILNKDIKLASLEASYRLPRGAQVGVYYRWTDTRTYEKDPSDFFPLDTRLKVGTLGLRTVFDRFDNLFDPRSGWGLTSDLGWSGGAVGSDLEYVSWISNYSLALEPYSDATWMQSVRVGVVEPLKNTNLHPDALLFAGGQSSIRGFDLNSVIPLTDSNGSLVPILPPGGGALFILNEEMRIPVWSALRLAVFADIGQVWKSWRDANLDFAVGVGFGVRWSTPIGPLWADVAWPVANVGISSDKPKFYLGIGRPF